MTKKLAFVLALALSVVSLGSAAMAHHKPDHAGGPPQIDPVVVVEKKIEICHSRQPNPSQGGGQGPQNNPYGPKRIEVNQSAADGNAGNNNGQGDHFSEHTGPIFDGTGQDFWGDIIPPIPGVHNGLNWTVLGQATWNNDCQPLPLIDFDIECVFENGAFQNVVTVENNGNAEGEVTVNGEVIELDPSESAERTFAAGVNVEIVVNGQTVYNQVPVCEGGRGAGDPDTPATSVAQVSETPQGGVGAGGGAVLGSVAALASSVGAAGFGAFRLRKTLRG